MSVRVTPRTSHSPRNSRSALARTAALVSAQTPAAASGGRTALNLRSPVGGGPMLTICALLTWRRDQAAARTWSRARHATSAGVIRAIRRPYQPSRDVPRRDVPSRDVPGRDVEVALIL